MAEASAELVRLKLLAPKRALDKITIVNHTTDEKMSCTVADGIKAVAYLVEKGLGWHNLHIVDQKAEKVRKLTNPDGCTRRVFNCRTPEQYKEFNAALEPYYEEGVDPHVAIDCIIRALRAFSRGTIRTWVQQGHEPSPSNLPDFLK